MKVFNWGIAALTAVFATALIAQSNETTTSAPETTLKVNSRAVLVDVVVTDRNGNPDQGPEAGRFQGAGAGQASGDQLF